MYVLIYANKAKDPDDSWQNSLKKILKKEEISYKTLSAEDLNEAMSADALFVLGGDGTILGLTEFSNKNGIPIIGINAGKLGFLTEFEREETEKAVKLFKEKALKTDARATLKITLKDKTFYALNDAVVSRIYNEKTDGLILSVSVNLDGIFVDKISGDGVIVSTPTGSTAYSLSAGGAILAPGINAFIMTPLSAHSLHQRPIVFSSDSVCGFDLSSDNAGLFIDGKLVGYLNSGDEVIIRKTDKKTAFLRKKEYNFYKRLDEKLSD